MPEARPRRVSLDSPGPDRLPDLRQLIPSWHREAACVGAVELFGAEGPSPWRASKPTSTVDLARLLHCEGCPVRRRCLRDALDPPVVPGSVAHDDSHHLTDSRVIEPLAMRAWGCWGGTLDHDRHLVRHLPPEEAARVLDESFPDRLHARVEAWTAWLPSKRSRTAWDRWIADRLGIAMPPVPRPCRCGAPRFTKGRCGACRRERRQRERQVA